MNLAESILESCPNVRIALLRGLYKIKSVDGKPTYKASLVAKDYL